LDTPRLAYRKPASPVTARPNLLGVTKRGRHVFPSLRAQEGQQSGQWNPRSIMRPTPAPQMPLETQPPVQAPPGLPPPLPPPPGLPPPTVEQLPS
jgi:hypothetical protein